MVFRMVGANLRVRSSSLRARRSDSSRAVDRMLRRSWLILFEAGADFGEAALLAQRGAHLALQVLELAVDDADLVVAVGRWPGGRGSSGARRKATMSADRSCKGRITSQRRAR